MERETLLREGMLQQNAGERLDSWIAGTWALSLLRAAIVSGIFNAAHTPTTTAQIAAETGLNEGRVRDICAALDANGIFEREGQSYRISHAFAQLIGPTVVQSLQATVDAAVVAARALEASATSDKVYIQLPSEDLLAIAKGEGALPSSPTWQAYMASVANAMPEVKQVWEMGGRLLDLGCGAGGTLLTTLVIFPRVSAVGVDIDDRVLEETRRRAVEVGVIDRLELRCTDAGDLDEKGTFDTVFWSQVYFPFARRAAALVAARRALKPGGYLIMPLFHEPPTTSDELYSPAGRISTMFRLIFAGWSIKVLSAQEVQAEVEAAGFEFVRIVLSGASRLLVMRVADSPTEAMRMEGVISTS